MESSPNNSLKERFMKFVNIPENTDDCWLWIGYRNRAGYGWFHISGHTKSDHAQRVSWLLNYGDPGNQHVLHKCDNPACVNPNHLFLGNQKINMQDRQTKNRQPKGEDIGTSYLTEIDIHQIRYLGSTNEYTHNEIAEMFKTTRRNVGLIINKKRWKYI